MAAVSHDLRSPLMVLRMGAEVLDRSIVDPDARRTLNRMRSSADRILSMLEQLYDLARARLGGGITIDPRVASFRILADKVLDELRLAHPERRLQIAYVSVSMDGVWDELRLARTVSPSKFTTAARFPRPSGPISSRRSETARCLERVTASVWVSTSCGRSSWRTAGPSP